MSRRGLTADPRAQVGIELAPLIMDKVTGKPKRDPSTGYMMNHSLSTTDVTQLATSKGYIECCITLSYCTCIQAPALARCREQAAVLGATHRLMHTCDCAAVARFQENEGVQKSIHNAIRYHADKDFKSAYHAELEQQIQQRDDRAQQVRDQDVTISRQLEVQ